MRVRVQGSRLASAGRPDALSCQGLISSCDGIGNGCPRLGDALSGWGDSWVCTRVYKVDERRSHPSPQRSNMCGLHPSTPAVFDAALYCTLTRHSCSNSAAQWDGGVSLHSEEKNGVPVWTG